MALVTLCPGCRTTFRVTPSELKARGGDVRCGECRQIFNSFATLITVDESEIYDSSRLANKESSEVRPVARFSSNSSINATVFHESGKPLAYYLKQELAPVSTPKQEPALAVQQATSSLPSPSVSPDPDYNFDAKPQPKKRRLWALAGGFFLIALMGLTGFLYRTEISAAIPATRLYLERICELFSCTVPYPQDITLLSIESSELQTDPTKQPDVAKLTATIRNYAPFSQTLPSLKLTLTDQYDQIVATHVYQADDYLGAKKNKIQIIEPGQEIDIQFELTTPNVYSTGYRLLLLNP